MSHGNCSKYRCLPANNLVCPIEHVPALQILAIDVTASKWGLLQQWCAPELLSYTSVDPKTMTQQRLSQRQFPDRLCCEWPRPIVSAYMLLDKSNDLFLLRTSAASLVSRTPLPSACNADVNIPACMLDLTTAVRQHM